MSIVATRALLQSCRSSPSQLFLLLSATATRRSYGKNCSSSGLLLSIAHPHRRGRRIQTSPRRIYLASPSQTIGKTMQWRALSVATLCHLGAAWNAVAPFGRQQSTRTGRSFGVGRVAPESLRSTSSMASTTVLQELPVSQASNNNDRTIAEGSVVARHPGGLVAVRLTEEAMSPAMIARILVTETGPLPAVVGVTPPALASLLDSSTAATSTAGELKTNKNAMSTGDYQGKRVVFPDGGHGVIIAHRPPLVFCLMEDKPKSEGTPGDGPVLVKLATAQMSVTGRLMDCFGRNLEASSAASSARSSGLQPSPIFAAIPKISDIALIDQPMITGVTMFDVLTPIGRGQNMLLIGDDLGEMQSYSRDFIKTQLALGTKCVYASTHGRIDDLRSDFAKDENMYFVAPSAPKLDDASAAAEAVAIASAACAVAESYALQEGKHTLVVVDNIDLHKKFWGVTTNVLVDIFGVDSVVQSDLSGGASSEMRGFFSSLVQRAAQFNAANNGGSVTLLLLVTVPEGSKGDDEVYQLSDFEQVGAKIRERISLLTKRDIPLTAANLRKLNIPIPSAKEGERRMVLQHIDDLISMSDGQIWLDDRLRNSGRYPPMDPQRSMTRIGIGADTPSRADAPALRRIAEGVRLDLSQAASMDGAAATVASQRQARKLQSFLLATHQPPSTGQRRLSESCVAILAAKEGHLDGLVDGFEPEESRKTFQDLLDHVSKECPIEMNEIDSSLDISEEAKATLNACIRAFSK